MKYVDWNDNYIESITTPLQFIGEIPSLDVCKETGLIAMYRGQTVISTGNNWKVLEEICDTQSREHAEEEIIFQCRNCGAPTYHDGTCPYCGTINRKVKTFYAR